ncbi:MAG: YIP1 family protein [Phycisphaerae bacterium]|nr:YIP1 family protein [Phycisphaerae bacterium]
MRCRTCEYRLWNLHARRCPECGAPFRPSDYDFVPNTVQFLCPHCNQAYYGTDAHGHLEPRQFNCVSCGTWIDMDEMLLLPTEGVAEEKTGVLRLPWLERATRGRMRAWWDTVKLALVSPRRMMQALPARFPSADGWGFFFLTQLLVMAVGILSVTLLWAAGAVFGGGGGGVAMFSVMFGFMAVTVAALLILVMIWGVVAHGLLRLTGETHGGLGRTYAALCYSSGANLLSAVPCCGVYVGWIWWLVSAVLAVAEAQRVRGGRAALAVLTPPLTILAVFVGLYAWFLVFVASWAGPMPAARNTTNTQGGTGTLVQALLNYTEDHDGGAPAHAILLLVNDHVAGTDFLLLHTATTAADVPVARTTLEDFELLRPTGQRAAAETATKTLPDGTIAHRLGDFVFTYHGIDLSAPDSRLWLVIASPDPDVNAGVVSAGDIVVGCADGSLVTIPQNDFATKRVEQNAVRAEHGLSPLPDPATVTHAKPAVPQE